MKDLIRKTITPEFIRFVVVGVLSAVIEFGLFFLFKMGWNYLIANVLAFACTNVVTFILSRRYVFATSGNNRVYEATLFTVFLMGALLVNQAVLWVMVEFAFMEKGLAKAIAIAVTVIWNFFTRKYFVFRNREVATQRSPRDFGQGNP